MASVEEVAREAARRLFGGKDKEIDLVTHVNGGNHVVTILSQDDNPRFGADMRDRAAAVATWAIEEALRSVPVPGPVSAERLEAIHARYQSVSGEIVALTKRDTQDIFAHIVHLTRILQDVAQDGPGAALLKAAREEGRREMKERLETAAEGCEAMVRELQLHNDTQGAGHGIYAARFLREAVRQAIEDAEVAQEAAAHGLKVLERL